MSRTNDARSTYAASLAYLDHRDELPFLLNARGLRGCGVEVGVQEGNYSAIILESWEGEHLISVDPWREDAPDAYLDIANRPQSVQDGLYRTTCAQLRPYGSRSSIWRMTSLEASRLVPHHSLDFVYLDARHDYASVVEDLVAWYDRIRPGGILAGHDYIDGNFPHVGLFGVRSAVDEFFAERGLRVHATSADGPWVSWMVEIARSPRAGHRAGRAERAPEKAIALGHAERAPDPARVVRLEVSVGGVKQELELALDPGIPRQRAILDDLQANHSHQPETGTILARALGSGDTFVDVGAEAGYFSVLGASLVGETGRVFGVEPEAGSFRQLTANVARNASSAVEALQVSLGDGEGSAAGASLDAVLQAHEVAAVKLIRIDAAGDALRILRGAGDTLGRLRVPFLVVEVDPAALAESGDSEEALRGHMAGYGYDAFQLRPTEVVRLAPDQAVAGAHRLIFRHSAAPAL